ncbi:hypothetical protein [Anaeromicrobium sediminis]|uniref:Uncharacterized protein n=1 Tax=Anaeromicrobium sediminis TaxID=1478221 RepID=A0A267MQ74_9FIRM|nr:hypothetical protein [Anaeromicrobium sediminis]PAB61048.1 hypothetical protein CCE28_01055 [Anaeromicrobium sediminis]
MVKYDINTKQEKVVFDYVVFDYDVSYIRSFKKKGNFLFMNTTINTTDPSTLRTMTAIDSRDDSIYIISDNIKPTTSIYFFDDNEREYLYIDENELKIMDN